jgi:hypothetical protein
VSIIAIAAISGVVLCELYVRFGLARRIDPHFNGMPLWLQNQTLVPSEIDKITGTKYEVVPGGLLKANTHFDMGLEVNGAVKLDFSVRTNNLGLLSDRPAAVERSKEQPEFRILMFGDSLTGTVTANYEWVDTVEELLNAKKPLRAAVKGREFRVYNLGVVAAGFSSFWKYYEQVGSKLDADLIVVNFIDDDYRRRDSAPRFTEEERAGMVAHAADILQRLQRTGIPVVMTQLPMYYELVPKRVEFPITKALEAKLSGVRIVDMRQHLPVSLGPAYIGRWYNLPYDHHFSDYGGELYARAMAKVIATHLDNKDHDFTADRSRYFNPAACMPPPLAPVSEGSAQALDFDAPEGVVMEVKEKPVSLGNAWNALAGGARSGALAEVGISVEGALIFKQVRRSTYGSPSITKTLPSAASFAGEAIDLRFSVRGQGAGEFLLNVTRYYSARNAPAEEVIGQMPFSTSSVWTEVSLPVSVPDIAREKVGPGDLFRLQVTPANPAAEFTLEMSPIRVYRRGKAWTLAERSGCAERPRDATAVRRILNDPKAVASLRAAVKDTLGRAKVWSLRPYGFEMTFRGMDPLIPPLTKPLNGGFVRVSYGSGKEDFVYLNIFCTFGEVSLHNPACYTNQHFFVR